MTAENDSGSTPEIPIRTMKKELGKWLVTVAILVVAVAATVSTLLTLLVISLTDTDDGVQASQTAIIETAAIEPAEEPATVDPPGNSSKMEMDSKPEPPVMEYGQFPEPESSDMFLMMLFLMMMTMADQEAYSPTWSDYGYEKECYDCWDYQYEECYSYESCVDDTEPYYEYGDDDYAEEEYYEYEYEDSYPQYGGMDDFYEIPPFPYEKWDPEALALYIELLELLSQNFPTDDFG